MALPTDPRKLINGAFDRYGNQLAATSETVEAERLWQLEDDYITQEVQQQWSSF